MFGSVSQFFRIFFRLLNASYAILFFFFLTTFYDLFGFPLDFGGFWEDLGILQGFICVVFACMRACVVEML